MKKIAQLLAVAGVLAVSAAPAIADQALAQAKGCMACHALDKKMVGPAYKDVANKYSEADVPKLVEKVKKGGSGVWGPVPMPPHPQVAEADIEKIVRWVLTLK
ncbi:c-type cytochrome [Hydrogenophilus thiooxidans]|uniref:c-type cytochrome n=1 Tax=Hydrogenophilus thiooxidans TaxID=2820326 RepID=UPI003211C0A5